MLERLAQIKDSLCLYAGNKKIDLLTAEEWRLLDEYVRLLKLFEEITEELCCPETSISTVIPLIKSLSKILDNELISVIDIVVRDFVSKLQEEFSQKFGHLENSMLHAVATYFDPRYKAKSFCEFTLNQIQKNIN